MAIRTPAIVLGTALCLSAAPLAAQDAEGWQTQCKPDRCTLTISMTEAQSGRRASTFVAIVNKDGTNHLGALVPLGTAIEAGIRLVAEDTEIKAPFQSCFPDGCRGFAEVNAATLDAFAGADTAEIQFFALGQERPLSVAAPMAGLSQALASARAELGQ